MADAGHVATDKILKELEKDVAREYAIAVKDMESKLAAYLQETEAKRKIQEDLLTKGVITQKEYSDWCYRHTMVGKRWEEMRDTLAADMHHTNEIAMSITKGRMPDVYALNANFATYQIEIQGIDTGFTLYNHDTAEYLLGDQRQLMPKPSKRKAAQIAANKDMQWNKQKIQSAVLQGVLQGESPYSVAQRLRNVGQMNYNASVRYARTMTTSAQNAGRYQAYRRATKLGVDLTIEWSATLDGRTRHDHRMMHGQRRNVNEPFKTPDGFEILYPADCTGDSYELQGEIWNCRCTLLSWVKGFEGDTVKSSPKMGDMTFEEWQKANAPKETKFNAEKFKTDMEDYVSGGYELNTLLSKEEKRYIIDNMEQYSKPIFRVEDARHTADKLDNDEIDPDGFSFEGNMRSFSKKESVIKEMLNEMSDNYAGIEDPVIFEIIGNKMEFDMTPYTTGYTLMNQEECLAGGVFEMVDEDMIKVNGQFIRKIKLRQKKAPTRW